MTVLGGARPLPTGALRVRPAPLGGARRAAPARPITTNERRRVNRRSRVSHRAHPVGALMAGVIVLFLLGLVFLAQTKQLTAAHVQIDDAIARRDDLYRQVQTTQTSVLRWGTEATVVERGQRLGLEQLPTRIRLADR